MKSDATFIECRQFALKLCHNIGTDRHWVMSKTEKVVSQDKTMVLRVGIKKRSKRTENYEAYMLTSYLGSIEHLVSKTI